MEMEDRKGNLTFLALAMLLAVGVGFLFLHSAGRHQDKLEGIFSTEATLAAEIVQIDTLYPGSDAQERPFIFYKHHLRTTGADGQERVFHIEGRAARALGTRAELVYLADEDRAIFADERDSLATVHTLYRFSFLLFGWAFIIAAVSIMGHTLWKERRRERAEA